MNVKARLGEADIGWCLTMVSPHLSQYHLLLLLALLHRVPGTGHWAVAMARRVTVQIIHSSG